MRAILWFAFLTISLFGCSGNPEEGKSGQTPTFVEAPAANAGSTRSFQMALWFNPSGADADIAFFTEQDVQPQGRSVLFLEGWRNLDGEAIRSDFAARISGHGYDWSRIAAVVVDEPYWYYTGGKVKSNPCRNPRDRRREQITQIAAQVKQAAAIIRELSPATRFWVNFSVYELQWAADSECPVPINDEYIDVISLDAYWGRFEDVAWPYYEWLRDNRASAYQQLALVPGTFYREGVDDQNVQASYLASYFAYANSLNENCNLPKGRVGVTGLWDGCAVWLVAGWSGATHAVDKYLYRGALDPAATVISATWREKLAYPTLDPFVGSVEKYDPATRTFTGWAVNRNTLGVPQRIELWVNGKQASSTVADLHRADVGDQYGVYEAGFTLTLPRDAASEACGNIEVRAASPTAAPRNVVAVPSAMSSAPC